MDRHFLSFEHAPAPADEDLDESIRLGRPLMAAILRETEAAGGSLAGPLERWEDYGWTFTLKEGPARIAFMLQRADEWLLMCWAIRGLGDRFRGRRFEAEAGSAQERVAAAVGKVIGALPPRWMTSSAFEG